MKKPVIKLGLQGDKLGQMFPQGAKYLVPESKVLKSIIDLIMFPHDSSKVVTSSTVEKVLSKVTPSNNKLVVVGFDFTTEARSALEDLNAIVISEHYFGWTDERWNSLKQKK